MHTKSVKDHGTTAVSFNDYIKAEHFYQELIARGYGNDDITIIMSDKTREMLPDNSKIWDNDSVADDAGKGALTWGAIWGILWAILALGTSVVFPVAWLVIAWPLLGALVWGWAGSIAGSAVWAIAHTGISRKDAENYSERIDTWEIVIVVDAKTADDVHYFNETGKKYQTTYYTTTYDVETTTPTM